MSKYALIIANSDYTDPGLAKLAAPGRDAEDFARVLNAKDIGAFDDVTTFINESKSVVREGIDSFFSMKKPDDLLLAYFSGHGVRDEYGSLYLAVKNTNRSRLRSTAIKSDFVRESMDQSRSRRIVLILDCCNSGAFAHGTKAAIGVSVGTGVAFEGTGYGRIVLTATDATQFAWEGDQVIGETDNSLFTHFLVKGLEGAADEDGDGKITVDELYDYAYGEIVSRTPKQTPGKWSYKQQGEIVLRQAVHIEDTKPIPLPADLIAVLESSYPSFRESAVRQLEELLKSRNVGLARAARVALERVAVEDDSRRVAQLAAQVLEPIHQAEQKAEEERITNEKALVVKKAHEEAEHLAAQPAEEERIAFEKAQVEQKVNEEAKRLAAQQAEEQRVAHEKLELEQKTREIAERLAVQQAAEERLTREKVKQEAFDGQQQREQAEREMREKTAREKPKQPVVQGSQSTQSSVKKYFLAMGLPTIIIVSVLCVSMVIFTASKWITFLAAPATSTVVPIATAVIPVTDTPATDVPTAINTPIVSNAQDATPTPTPYPMATAISGMT